MEGLFPVPGPDSLAFLVVLAAAGGADLGLTVLLLGLMPRLGWDAPPGLLPLLQAPAVMVSAGCLYLAELVAERSPLGFALWHTFQRWVRLVALLLLVSLATPGMPPLERGALSVAVTLLGAGVYAGTSGWQGLAILRRRSESSRWTAALTGDAAFAALLVLALDDGIRAAIALGILLAVTAIQLPAALRAHGSLVRAGKARLRALIRPGRWIPEEELPPGVQAAVRAAAPGATSPLRGAGATLLASRIRSGWLVVTPAGPVFADAGGSVTPLSAAPGTPCVTGPLHIRRPVRIQDEEGEILVLRDGPPAADLQVVISANVAV